MSYLTLNVSLFNVSITLVRYMMIVTLTKQCLCVNLYYPLTCVKKCCIRDVMKLLNLEKVSLYTNI